MQYPQLNEIPRSQEFTQTFGGLNLSTRIGDGEFADMRNLSGDLYPVMSPRKQRSIYYTHNGYIRGVYMKGGHIVHVSGNTAYLDGKSIGLSVSGGTEQPVRIVGMGVHVVFFPGGEWFDLVEYTTTGKLVSGEIYNQTEVSCGVTNPETGEVPHVWFNPAKEDGTKYETVVTAEPTSPKDGTLWLDNSGEAPVARVYNENSKSWVILAVTYIRIEGTGIGVGFKVGDGVKISGAAFGYGEEFTSLVNGSFTIKALEDDWILIPGILSVRELHQEVGTITVKRAFPEMDYVVEVNNRLWGCKYGQVYVDGKLTNVNEIYACALGDFTNWNKYEGLSTDSYTASQGSDGAWTGAITYQGKPMFFKADSVSIVTVGSAGNHTITTRQMRGHQEGNSLAIVGDVLYYCTGREIVAYNGTYPETVSGAIPGSWDKAIAGGLGNKYYICLTKGGTSTMYVYDTVNGFWHKEDEVSATMFAGDSNGLFFVSGNEIWKVEAGDRSVDWMAQTGIIGLNEPGKKYISRITLRAELPKGAYIDIDVRYNSGEWRKKGRLWGRKQIGSQVFPIIPVRCDHMEIRLRGYGECKLYSIGKVREGGSEL